MAVELVEDMSIEYVTYSLDTARLAYPPHLQPQGRGPWPRDCYTAVDYHFKHDSIDGQVSTGINVNKCKQTLRENRI